MSSDIGDIKGTTMSGNEIENCYSSIPWNLENANAFNTRYYATVSVIHVVSVYNFYRMLNMAS